MLVSETWTFDWTGIFSGCRDQSFASNSASILSMREFERPAWRNCLKSATPLAAQVSVALTRMSRGARRSEAISSPASNRRPRLLMGSGPLCSASNYSAARANAIGGETALQHMQHQSRHACPAVFAPYCRGSAKNLRLEKPRIKCEWRDRCNRYSITARVTMINQHIAIGRTGDRHDD